MNWQNNIYEMKYLKTFESINTLEKLKNFCIEYLINLFDNEELIIDITQNVNYDRNGQSIFSKCKFVICIEGVPLEELKYALGMDNRSKPFFWAEIKDYFIPFAEVLNDEFSILAYHIDFHHTYFINNPIKGINWEKNFITLTQKDITGDNIRYNEYPIKRLRVCII